MAVLLPAVLDVDTTSGGGLSDWGRDHRAWEGGRRPSTGAALLPCSSGPHPGAAGPPSASGTALASYARPALPSPQPLSLGFLPEAAKVALAPPHTGCGHRDEGGEMPGGVESEVAKPVATEGSLARGGQGPAKLPGPPWRSSTRWGRAAPASPGSFPQKSPAGPPTPSRAQEHPEVLPDRPLPLT